jgi:hypothetical protein
MNVTVVVVDGV